MSIYDTLLDEYSTLDSIEKHKVRPILKRLEVFEPCRDVDIQMSESEALLFTKFFANLDLARFQKDHPDQHFVLLAQEPVSAFEKAIFPNGPPKYDPEKVRVSLAEAEARGHAVHEYLLDRVSPPKDGRLYR